MIGRRPAHDLCPDCAGPASGPFETEAEARAAARHITATPPGTRAWQADSRRLLCEALTAAGVDPAADEYVWVDEQGRQTGTDPDLHHLPDPYAHLTALGALIMRGAAQRKGKRAEPTWLWWAAGREYGALKVRLEMGGTFHVHQPGSPGPAYEGAVPWCCGWPGWLRPGGRQCRQYGAALAVAGAA